MSMNTEIVRHHESNFKMKDMAKKMKIRKRTENENKKNNNTEIDTTYGIIRET